MLFFNSQLLRWYLATVYTVVGCSFAAVYVTATVQCQNGYLSAKSGSRQ